MPLLAALAALLLFASGALAQPRGSERGTMTQIVNGTTITLDFGRPVARGRENLFGGVVHWGETWTRELFDVADEMTLRILVEDDVSTGAEFLWEGEVFGIGEKVGR